MASLTPTLEGESDREKRHTTTTPASTSRIEEEERLRLPRTKAKTPPPIRWRCSLPRFAFLSLFFSLWDCSPSREISKLALPTFPLFFAPRLNLFPPLFRLSFFARSSQGRHSLFSSQKFPACGEAALLLFTLFPSVSFLRSTRANIRTFSPRSSAAWEEEEDEDV